MESVKLFTYPSYGSRTLAGVTFPRFFPTFELRLYFIILRKSPWSRNDVWFLGRQVINYLLILLSDKWALLFCEVNLTLQIISKIFADKMFMELITPRMICIVYKNIVVVDHLRLGQASHTCQITNIYIHSYVFENIMASRLAAIDNSIWIHFPPWKASRLGCFINVTLSYFVSSTLL